MKVIKSKETIRRENMREAMSKINDAGYYARIDPGNLFTSVNDWRQVTCKRRRWMFRYSRFCFDFKKNALTIIGKEKAIQRRQKFIEEVEQKTGLEFTMVV